MFHEGPAHPFRGIGAVHAEPRQDVARGKEGLVVTGSDRARRHPRSVGIGDGGAPTKRGLGRSLWGGRATFR